MAPARIVPAFDELEDGHCFHRVQRQAQPPELRICKEPLAVACLILAHRPTGVPAALPKAPVLGQRQHLCHDLHDLGSRIGSPRVL